MDWIAFIIKSVGGCVMVVGEWLACIAWKDITTELPWRKHHTIAYGLMLLGAALILIPMLF